MVGTAKSIVTRCSNHGIEHRFRFESAVQDNGGALVDSPVHDVILAKTMEKRQKQLLTGLQGALLRNDWIR